MASQFSLNNKVVVITGAAGFLGQAFSGACAEAGATVVMLDISSSELKTAADKISAQGRPASGGKSNQVFYYVCDTTSPAQINKTLKTIIKNHKTIDALVNNAYPRNKNYGAKFDAVTYKDFCENLSTHAGGYFLLAQQVIKLMQKSGGGSVVNLGSIYGTHAPDFSIYNGTTITMPVEYSAIKGAIINLTRYLAAYAGQYKIRVNTLSPGGVENNQSDKFIRAYNKKVPLGNRMATPEDLTGPLVFLLSDASKYLTGQNLIVDGGWTI